MPRGQDRRWKASWEARAGRRWCQDRALAALAHDLAGRRRSRSSSGSIVTVGAIVIVAGVVMLCRDGRRRGR